MYFKNDFGKAHLENEKLYVDTDVCTITIEQRKTKQEKISCGTSLKWKCRGFKWLKWFYRPKNKFEHKKLLTNN